MRYQIRGPHGSRGPARWTVVDTEDTDVAVDHARTRDDAREIARELNELELTTDPPTEESR